MDDARLQLTQAVDRYTNTRADSALSLFSLTEATTHMRNLATLLFKPGVNVIQFAKAGFLGMDS